MPAKEVLSLSPLVPVVPEELNALGTVRVAGDSLRTPEGIVSWERHSTCCPPQEKTHWRFSKELDTDDYSGEVVKINLPPPQREDANFPQEKWKTLLAYLFLNLSVFICMMSLAIVHERMPDRTKNPPLPDVVFDLVSEVEVGLFTSDYLLIIVSFLGLSITFLQKYRFIILRRICLIVGLLYLMRAITILVTQIPVASEKYYCSPKANTTSPWLVIKRAAVMLSGLGLSISGKHVYCGDYMYSGHTAIYTVAYLVIKEYTPPRFFLLHWFSWCLSAAGILMMTISRGHYTIDIIIAYYVASRVFFIYHTLANNASLKTKCPTNFLSRLWWFKMFQYFEGNVSGVVPLQFDWPLPSPRRFVKHDRKI